MEDRLRQTVASGGPAPRRDGLPESVSPSPTAAQDDVTSLATIGAGEGVNLTKGQHGRVIRVLKAALLGATQVRGLIDHARDLTRQAHATAPQATAERAALAADFDILRQQIDQTVEDASYAGSNLLAGQTPMPNGDRRVTHGLLVVLDGPSGDGPLIRYHDLRTGADGLGLAPARNGWSEPADIDWAVEQLDTAHWHVQQSWSELAVNLRMLTFPTPPASVEGDHVEGDGAGLILQVREQLAGTEHGLATPTQKSILRLF